jgi:Tfp pilus assembly protein PilF
MVTALFVAVLWLLAPSAPFRHAATRRWARQVAFHRLPTARYASGSNSNGGTGTATTTTTAANTDAADATAVSEDELDALMSIALGEEYYKELNAKVAAAKQDEWDVRQGVNPSRTKPLPLKANLDLWTYTARGQLLKGNFTAAEQLYNKCVDYDPCDGRAWLGLARLQWKKGQALAAEKCYKDGLYYSPNNPFLLQGWAVMLEKLGKIPQATKLLTKSVRANPRHSASWVALGRLHQRAGKVDEARYCFSSAVDGDPRSYVALQAWGVLEAETGNAQAARGLFQRAVDASGGRSVHALQAWATLEKKAGNLDEAEKLLEQAVKAWPESTRVRLSMAELHELRGDGARARETFQKAQRKAEARGDAGFFQVRWKVSTAVLPPRAPSVCDPLPDPHASTAPNPFPHGRPGPCSNCGSGRTRTPCLPP